MTERTKVIECPNCEGAGYGECRDYDEVWREVRCPDCLGTGEARQLMTEEEIAAEAHERAEERHESWLHDAYDRAGDR